MEFDVNVSSVKLIFETVTYWLKQTYINLLRLDVLAAISFIYTRLISTIDE